MAHYKGARLEEDRRHASREYWANFLVTPPSKSPTDTIEEVKKWMSTGEKDQHFGS